MTNNIELSSLLPAHVQEFIQRNDTVGKGLAVIEKLETEDDFIVADTQLEATEKTAAILRGFLYIHYRKSCAGRNFLEFLSKRGIPQRTAYDYIGEAEIYAELTSADMCATVSKLGHIKTRLLKEIPTEDRSTFLSGEPLNGVALEDAAGMNNNDFKEFIADYKRSTCAELIKANQEIEEYKLRTESLSSELMHLQQMNDEKYDDVDLPHWVVAIREEAAVHGEMALQHLAGLEKALTVLKGYDAVGHDSPEKFSEYRAAASVTFYQIANLLVQTSGALKHAKTFLGDEEVGEFDMSLPITETEAAHITRITARLTEKLNAKEHLRVSDRIVKQGRVGAPKKKPKAYEDEL